MTRICGVSISSGSAIFAVLEGTKKDYTVVDTTLKKLELGDDTDQDQMKAFYTAVEAFFKQYKIDVVFVKKGSTSGKFSAGSKSFKIEALIQLMPIKVHFVASQTVAAFFKKHSISDEIGSSIFKYQEDALKLGFYGLQASQL